MIADKKLYTKIKINRTMLVEIGAEPVENFDRFKHIKHSKVRPKAFTDKGLYMLATILKSPKSTQTTIAIIETYSKFRQFSKAIQSISENKNEKTNNELIEKGRTILSEILVGDTQGVHRSPFRKIRLRAYRK
ncbi:MAG: hypothetical protein EBR35_01320 [Flavobacteriales bacterium]|nr:hypothetical protein [Flavobacteriales bacterium]